MDKLDPNAFIGERRIGSVFLNRINEDTNNDKDFEKYTTVDSNPVSINPIRTVGVSSHIDIYWRLFTSSPDFGKSVVNLL